MHDKNTIHNIFFFDRNNFRGIALLTPYICGC